MEAGADGVGILLRFGSSPGRFDTVMRRCHDALMRTTLTLDTDAFQAAKAKAAHENISLGKAVSELILQGLRRPASKRSSSAVFRSQGGVYTAQAVEEALDDE